MNGADIEHVEALSYRLATQAIGATAELKVLSQGDEKTVGVELIRAPEGANAAEITIRGRSPFAGAKFADLSPRLAQRLGLDADIKGVTVIDIDGNSPAARFGFQPRDIVREVNGEEIDTAEKLKQVAEAPSRWWRFTVERDGKLLRQTLRTNIGLMADLFGADESVKARTAAPLADRLRPKNLAEVVGQEHLTGEDGALTRLIRSGSLGSMIFWGPPGTGKTTVARLLAGETKPRLRADIGDLLGRCRPEESVRIGAAAPPERPPDAAFRRRDPPLQPRPAGQFSAGHGGRHGHPRRRDHENPSFELNAALLSRARVLVFHTLGEESLEKLLARAEETEGKPLPLDEEARAVLLRMADGDGRAALTLAEEVWRAAKPGEVFDAEGLQRIVQRRAPVYDKGQDGHYNLISALHKSVRGSDPDAALYYLARMLDAGENPLYLGRRLVRMAMEDIGLADPQALVDRQRRQGRLRLSRFARRRTRLRRGHASIWRRRRNRTPSTPPSRRRRRPPRSTVRCCRRNTSSTRRPS